jgi:hypothetical protein
VVTEHRIDQSYRTATKPLKYGCGVSPIRKESDAVIQGHAERRATPVIVRFEACFEEVTKRHW